MSAPVPVVWAVVKERDEQRCVSCGARVGLQFQHRQATGMGGSKRRPLYHEGLTSCAVCNEQYENVLQRKALLCGWKVARWVKHPDDVPVLYPLERQWYLLSTRGTRLRVNAVEAVAMMRRVYGEQYDEWQEAA